MQPGEIKGTVDFGIITIREDEFKAVLERFPDRLGVVSGRRQYNLRQLPLGAGDAYTVAIVRSGTQGNTEAQQVTNALLDELAPRWLLVVGIASAAPAFDFTLGDVAISTQVCDFNVGAALMDSTRAQALSSWVTHPEGLKYEANLPALRDQLGSWYKSIGVPRPTVKVAPQDLYGDADWKIKVKAAVEHHFLGSARPPKVVAGAIACSDVIIKNTELFGVWQKVARQVVAVEMESAGIYRAAHERQVPALSIRGISDIVGFARDQAWTTYACHAAAALTRAFLQTAPLLPQAKAIRAPVFATESKAQRHLGQRELLDVHEAAVAVGLGQSRGVLLTGMDPHFSASLSVAPTPTAQLLSDLAALNQVSQLADGTVPLRTWLKNALALAGPRPESRIFEGALAFLPSTARADSPPSQPQAPNSAPLGGSAHGSPVRVFVAHVNEDETFLAALLRHLRVLERTGLADIWHTGQIPAGSVIMDEIEKRLDAAELIVLLVSADFLASDWMWEAILKRAFVRERDGAKVIPVIVRAVDWRYPPLDSLLPLPRSGIPIASNGNPDEALVEVAGGLRDIISSLRLVDAPNRGRAAGSDVSTPPPERILGIHKIFQPGDGPPEVTYVEPEGFVRLQVALRTKGRGLVVQGPSGIGKSTAMHKAFESIGEKPAPQFLQCFEETHRDAIDRWLNAVRPSGYLVLDDFHRLDERRQRAIADIIKKISDGGERAAKICVIGINDAGHRLFRSNPDIRGRVDIFSLQRQPDTKIAELIRNGETAANIFFKHRDDFIATADGSFFVAQQICLQAAIEERVLETQPVRKIVGTRPGDIIQHVMMSIEGTLDEHLIRFLSSDDEDRPRGVCLALLWLLSRSKDGRVLLAEAASQFPELRPTFNALGDNGLARRYGADPEIARLICCGTGMISIEDPLLTFYLRHVRGADLAQRAGLGVRFAEDGKPVFAVRHSPESSQGIAPAPRHFLDVLPFPWWDPKAQQFLATLMAAYSKPSHVEILAQSAGIDLKRWNGQKSLEEAWRSLIEESTGQAKLRRLLDEVLSDQSVAAFHPPLRELIA